MHRIRSFAIAAIMALATSFAAGAQTTVPMGAGGGGSPHQKTTWTVDGATISIAYGRPSLKGRPEAQMMPAGQPWRTGSDQATVLTTDKQLTFGAVTLAPGSYTINTQPGEHWQLIFGKLGSADQWGIPYLPKLEVGRTAMTLGHAAHPVEQLTISIDAQKSASSLRVEWGTTVAQASFHVHP